MGAHPDALDVIALARDGVDSAASSAVHHHCLVCEECEAVLRAVLMLRGGLSPSVATVSLPATAVTMQ